MFGNYKSHLGGQVKRGGRPWQGPAKKTLNGRDRSATRRLGTLIARLPQIPLRQPRGLYRFRMQRDGPRAAYYALHHPAGPGDPAPNSDAGRGLTPFRFRQTPLNCPLKLTTPETTT